MATYSRKKKTIIPSFPAYRDDHKVSQPAMEKAKKRVSTTISMTAFYEDNNEEPIRNINSNHDDSIKEMESRLLNEGSINRLNGEPCMRLSQPGSAKVITPFPRPNLSADKSLPDLPKILFNGDDAWAMKVHPVMTAAGAMNGCIFNDHNEPDSYPPSVFRRPPCIQKRSAPPLPRKSSKRRSVPSKQKAPVKRHNIIEKEQLQQTMQSFGAQIEKPNLSVVDAESITVSISGVNELNRKIEAMMSATKALKPPDTSSTSDLKVTTKKRRTKGSTVLAKIKKVLDSKLHDSGLMKLHVPVKEDNLLGKEVSELALPQYDEEDTSISSMEIRMNEGSNFDNPKIQSLTGHGNIKRKPIADDGKSLRSRRSIDDPFSSSTLDHSPTSFDDKLKSKAFITASKDVVPTVPNQTHGLKNEFFRVPKLKEECQAIDVDFNALFSSSPLAQSTPRIRLEPTFKENGMKVLKNVPSDSQSLFDVENSFCEQRIYIDGCVPSIHEIQKTLSRRLVSVGKRQSRNDKDISRKGQTQFPKAIKRHPSPSKADLEGLEVALRQYSPSYGQRTSAEQGYIATSSREPHASIVLSAKDTNKPLGRSSRQDTSNKGLEVFVRCKSASRLTVPVKSFAAKSRETETSEMPLAKSHIESHITMQDIDESTMDIDELQWDKTAYNIGMRRV